MELSLSLSYVPSKLVGRVWAAGIKLPLIRNCTLRHGRVCAGGADEPPLVSAWLLTAVSPHPLTVPGSGEPNVPQAAGGGGGQTELHDGHAAGAGPAARGADGVPPTPAVLPHAPAPHQPLRFWDIKPFLGCQRGHFDHGHCCSSQVWWSRWGGEAVAKASRSHLEASCQNL